MLAYGEKLYDEYLNKIDMSQRQLAVESDIDPGVINHMIAGDSVGYGQGKICAERQYKILRALSSHLPLYPDNVRTLLQQIPRANLTDTEREDLITKLVNEGIVTSIYYTDKGIQFIGREKEIEKVFALLQDEAHPIRFLTLVGAPGVGKSELAKQLQERAGKREYVVSYLQIIPEYTDINKLLERVEKELSKQPKENKKLLILDDCDEIVHALVTGNKRDDELKKVNAFLEINPKLTLVATSRHEFSYAKYEVKPLPVVRENESFEVLVKNESVQLFLEGMRQSQGSEYTPPSERDAPSLAKICQLLDGLPLALLIGSALIEQKGTEGLYQSLLDMSIQQFKSGYDKPERHVTLDALIEYSYIFLEEKEQKLLRWIAAFPPPDCRRDAITYICEAGDFFGSAANSQEQHDDIDAGTENLLTTLRKHYLVIYNNNVISMHNTVRRFGRRLLSRTVYGNERGIERVEAVRLLKLLLRYNSSWREHTFLKNIYNPQKLLEIAHERKFLENGNEDDKTIKKELDKIIVAIHGMPVWGDDCFRRLSFPAAIPLGPVTLVPNPLYSDLLDEVVEASLHIELKKGDQPAIPVTSPAIPADVRRRAFFTVFDNYYKAILPIMLLKEADEYLEFLLTYSRDVWEVWDSGTVHLIGLSAHTFVSIGHPAMPVGGNYYFLFN